MSNQAWNRKRWATSARRLSLALGPSWQSDHKRSGPGIYRLSRGDPESPLRWRCKRMRTPSEELKAQGHQTRRRVVAWLLGELG